MADNGFNPAHMAAYARAFADVLEATAKFATPTSVDKDSTPPEGAEYPTLHWDHALVQAHDEIVERIETYEKHHSPSVLVAGKIEGLKVALRVLEKHLPEKERRDV